GDGGAGYEMEHEQSGIPFRRIGARMDVLGGACRIVGSLWSGKRTTFEGQHYQLRDAMCEPKPLQEHLPLIIGGSGERRTLRIAAEHADGWNTLHMPLDEYRHKLDVLERHCADVGRDPAEIRKQLALPPPLAPTSA